MTDYPYSNPLAVCKYRRQAGGELTDLASQHDFALASSESAIFA
jgi:hypothetical protein